MTNKTTEKTTPRADSANVSSPFPPIVIALILTAVVVAIAALFYPPFGVDDSIGDGSAYIKIAQGKSAEVNAPFSARFLEAQIVRALIALRLVTLPLGFAILSAVGCLLLSWVIARCARAAFHRPELAALAILTPGMMGYYREGFGPEMLHAGVLALFFFVLARKKWWLAVLFIPVLYCIREATLLLVIVCLIIAWKRRMRALGIAIAIAGVIGAIISARVVAAGQPNIHQMSPIAYMAGKVVYNIPKNLLGIPIWTNTFSTETHEQPIWRMTLPPALRKSGITQVGIEPYEPSWPAKTAEAFLTGFGAAPAIAWFLWRRRKQSQTLKSTGTPASPASYWLAVAAAYGTVSFLMAPALGAAVARIVTYGWPIFWLAVPVALARRFEITPAAAWKLILSHLAIAWLPRIVWPASVSVFGWEGPRPFWVSILSTIAISIVLNIYIWRLLKSLPKVSNPAGVETDEQPQPLTL